MATPDFTDDERYLINCVKSPGASGGSSSYMWGYLIGGSIIAGFAAYIGSMPMMLSAFGVIVGFRIYEEWQQSKWLPQWRSIIVKYETSAVDDCEPADDSEPSAQC